MLAISPPILVLTVLWLDLAVGPIRFALRSMPAPPVVMGRIARSLTRRLDRPNRMEGTLRARGAVLAFLLVGGAALAGAGIETILRHLSPLGMAAIEGVVFWGFLRAQLPLARLRKGSRRVGSDGEAANGLLEQTAVSFVHFVIGPIFWLLLTGLPGVFAAAAAWAVDRAAQEAGSHRPFGAVAGTIEHLLSWVPGRIAELVLAIAAVPIPRGRPLAALSQAWCNMRLGQYGAVAALAGGLGVALRGPVLGSSSQRWLGTGTARVGRNDILRAMWLYVMALLVVSGILVFLAVLEQLPVHGRALFTRL